MSIYVEKDLRRRSALVSITKYGVPSIRRSESLAPSWQPWVFLVPHPKLTVLSPHNFEATTTCWQSLLPAQIYSSILNTVFHTSVLLPPNMSVQGSGLDRKFAINARFPSDHIQAFGFGEVGRIFLTFAANGSIRKAEAELIDAPYKRMLIDNPVILRMFGQRGDSIDMDALHPAAKFRMDPLETKVDNDGELDLTSFDVGRLVDITNMSASARFGWPLPTETEEGDVHRRVREAVELNKGKNVKRGGPTLVIGVAMDSVAKGRIDANKPPVPTTAVTPPVTTPPTESSSASKRNPNRNKPIPGGVYGKEMGLVFPQILARLPKPEAKIYTEYVTDGRKDAARSETNTAAFHQELRAFVEQHDMLELHNTYATAQSKSGSNKRYHLPVFADKRNAESQIEDGN
jgi:hypothetical protein